VPKVQALVKQVFGKEGHKGVNPDEVVAIGAAIQGAQLLLGSKSEVLLLDVTPLSLGIETLGGVLTKLIERNTTIPTTKKQVFSTAEDSQPAVTVRVFQGESPIANSASNRLLGQFNLEGIPPAPRGMPQVEVAFDIDHNGILHVSAKDLGTGKEQKIRIESSSGLSEDEIRRMVKDAESHAAEDRRDRELAEARNAADTLLYSTEKSLRDLGDKVTDADRRAIESAAAELRAVLDAGDIVLIRSRTDALTRAAYQLAEEVYKESSSRPPGAAGNGAAGGGPSGHEGSNGAEEPSGAKAGAEDADYEVVE
jgi:molecular chaperone DnaK